MKKKLFFLIFLMVVISCKKEIRSQTEIYLNDFETADLTNISNGQVELFNGSHVLGRYNASGFGLKLSGIPKHKLIKVEFDLYIHDSWNGNKLAPNGIEGPDIWKLLIDNNTYINTTFSNADCPANSICPPQSYPANYPNNNHNPRSGSYTTTLPGACSLANDPTGTTLYKIEKTIDHTSSELLLNCLDLLKQTNVADPKCDESWSVDNIKITAINL